MINRRSLFAALAAFAIVAAAPARAYEVQPYDSALVAKTIASGKPVIVYVYASWCAQCHIQAGYLENLKADKAYDGVQVFHVDYDGQKDVVTKLNCSRATVIGYKAGAEVGRMSFGIMKSDVTGVMNKAL